MIQTCAPSTPRVLIIDPAPAAFAVQELERFTALGLAPTVNLRRVTDPAVCAQIAARWDCIDIDGFDTEELVATIERGCGYDALKCRAGIPLTSDVLERATADTLDQPLRLVGRAATGLDTFDLDAARALNVAIRFSAGANAAAVAEFTIGLMLDGLRGISRRSAALHAADWSTAIGDLPARSLSESRVGIIGTGTIAREVATRLASFGTEVWVHGSTRFTPESAAGWPGRRTESLSELLSSCDVVTVHVPGTSETNALLGAAELREMRPNSLLVNTSRASVVPEEALDAVLRETNSGPSHACIDVFAREGQQFDSPLAGNPHATLTPHMAGMTSSAMRAASTQLLDEFARFYASGK
ncbi:NAD(P)-dependent oxidoreductase [Nocardia sp. NBC_00511]|uniref:NAD(P)-dependent oxidoreductase n=1 Tax=Nocardia sp. NBC_00511 TaxID=2903591 RepID=UPI0030DFA16B